MHSTLPPVRSIYSARVLLTSRRDDRSYAIEVTMPPTKRQKKSAGSQPQDSLPPSTAAEPAAPAEAPSEFVQLAKQHWLKPSKKATKVKVKNDVLKRDIWDPLEKDNFPLPSLLALEGLQILERSARPSCLDLVMR